MEEWKAIPGYEGLYEASNLGRIRVPEGRITVDSSGRIKHWPQKILKQKYCKRRTSDKYDARVCLCKNGEVKGFRVARLVALTWCEGFKNGMTVNHKDGDPSNNNTTNLEWVSNLENVRHGFKTGQYSSLQKPCTIVNSKGEMFSFPSRIEACHSIGRGETYISKCLRLHRPIRSASGELYDIA